MCKKLRAEFQPTDFDDRLWDEIKDRVQGTDESVGIFIAYMTRMFSRLSCKVSENVRVNVIRKNLTPVFQMHLGLVSIKSMEHLTSLCKMLERTKYHIDTHDSCQRRKKLVEPDLSPAAPSRRAREVHVVSNSPVTTACC